MHCGTVVPAGGTPTAYSAGSSPGSYQWGGVANTWFWIDLAEELTAPPFTQLVPSSAYPLRPQLRQLVHAALVD